MSIGTTYYVWQKSGVKPGSAPYNKTSPALISLLNYLKKRWGGKYLGGFNVRKIRGLDLYSVHSWGAAIDWRYEYPGPGRTVLTEVILPFLINNSRELGIQAIHDYRGCRIWRADRSGDKNGGWKKQKPGPGGMCADWGNYLHIEVNRAQWADGRTVEQKLSKGASEIVFDPAHGTFGGMATTGKPELMRGSNGDAVRYLQGVLRNAGYALVVDGEYGRQTENRVKMFQKANSLPVTGTVDAKTWKAIDKIGKVA